MSHSKGKVFIVQGPTASGKTTLAIQLAKKFQTEIISADSRQFYQEMSIGTAKPTPEELAEVKHHFVNSHSIHNDVSASQYAQEAKPILDDLLARNQAVVIVGGSGMFIDALTLGLDEIPHDKKVQEKWNALFESKGLEFLQNELASLDPVYFAEVDIHNPVRLIRALEVIELTQKPFSESRKGKVKYDYDIVRYDIAWNRADLYERIDRRVDFMIEADLFQEAKSLFPLRKLKALNTVGYSEFFRYWDNECNFDEAVEKIKQHTRNYAKRQLTWLKRYDDLVELNPYARESLIEKVTKQ
ncbi:MAG: tRNA (adenosine(37)-N6)-dimethylallyltransferase MiaA [Crocinitomicaceae bacterium]|nr:tRNA (adenosine(37)-N6)-dimethylallyltransferase MiaA [Crocinitomicaceae bacterium]